MSYGLNHSKRLAEKDYLSGGKKRKVDTSEEEETEKRVLVSTQNPLAHIDKICAKGNDIYFYSDINEHTYFKLNMVLKDTIRAMQILALDHGLDRPPTIKLHISSYGGLVFGGLSVVDTIKASPVEIHSIVEGHAASAATYISVICKKRYIRPHAFMLIHQMSSSAWGKADQILDEAENIKRITSITEEIYTSHTKMSKSTIRSLKKHDLWMKPDECLKKGLVDEILE